MKPRGGKRKFDILTTASDTTTVLDGSYRPDIILQGTGVNQVYDLGNALLYNPGTTHFIFYNNTPEFVGVVNSDSTVWHRVPPRARCICALQSNAAAAGVWWSEVVESKNPGYGFNGLNDYTGYGTGGAYYAEYGHWVAATGAGAAIGLNSGFITASPGRQGTIAVSTGTTDTGSVRVYNSGQEMNISNGCRAWRGSQALSALSVAADEFIIRCGIVDNIAGGAPTNACYFVYDRLTWGDVWTLRNIDAAGNNTVATAVVPAITPGTNWQLLEMEVSSAGARSDFWIDRVQVSPAGGLNTNMPTGAVNLYYFLGITKSAGLNSRRIEFDYTQIQSYPTVLR